MAVANRCNNRMAPTRPVRVVEMTMGGTHNQNKITGWGVVVWLSSCLPHLSTFHIHLSHQFNTVRYGTYGGGSIDSLVDQRVVYIHNMTYLSTSGGGRARLIYFFEFIYVFVLNTSLGRQSKLHSEKKYSALCRRPRRNDPFYYAT